MKKTTILFLCLVSILVYCGCSFSVPDSVPDSDIISVSSISISQNQIDLQINKSFSLGYTVFPSDATNKSVKWESTNTNIVTVNNGYVVAKGIGSAYIKVISQEEPTIYDYCLVKVQGNYNVAFNYSSTPFSITNSIGATLTVKSLSYSVEAYSYSNTLRIKINFTAITNRGFLLYYKLYDEQNIVKASSSRSIKTDGEIEEKDIIISLEYGTLPTSANFRFVFSSSRS